MCYYNGIRVSKEEYIRLLHLEKELKEINLVRDLASGFEYGNWPILKPNADGTDFVLEMAHWELIPYWIKDTNALAESRKKFTTLNATAEKLLESKMFRNPALKHRCLVLSSGFYEWRHFQPEGAKKEIAYPYYISLPKKSYFFMAGIYQPWTDKETGETMDTFAIVTTTAKSLMDQIHNKKKRMPTILPDALAWEWMQDGLSEDRIREIAGYQYNSQEMAARTIQKEFRTAPDPQTPYAYRELPALVE
jgi:putative SOS response-associated peptidase YedK